MNDDQSFIIDISIRIVTPFLIMDFDKIVFTKQHIKKSAISFINGNTLNPLSFHFGSVKLNIKHGFILYRKNKTRTYHFPTENDSKATTHRSWFNTNSSSLVIQDHLTSMSIR